MKTMGKKILVVDDKSGMRDVLKELKLFSAGSRMGLEAVFHGVQAAIIVLDKNMEAVAVNKAASALCGISWDSVGMTVNSFPEYCERKCLVSLEEAMSKRQTVKSYHIECNHRLRPSQVVSVTARPLSGAGNVLSGAVLVVDDKTLVTGFGQEGGKRHEFCNFIGASRKMREIYSQIEMLAGVQSTVLITGESGTGKELAAVALHHGGNRRDGPMVKLNCAALSETLLESELFGHVRGAFTGAMSDRIGRFQRADGGTIFLDEIGDTTPKTQLQLLRVLQEKEIERVGDSKPIKVDVRIITATNQDLRKKIRQGKFREDLYYRLKVVGIHLPPLREKREDIVLLTNHFLGECNRKFNMKKISGVSSDVQDIFMNYSWPGNVRELMHTVEHAFLYCQKDIITVDDLAGCAACVWRDQPSLYYADDKQAILLALEKATWSRSRAARLLGMSRSTFYRKIKEYKIKLPNE